MAFEPCEIVERIDLTPELMVMKVRPRTHIPFIPGQFVRLGLLLDGRIAQRSYSIVSAPGEELLEFLFELVPGGRLTPKIWNLGVGDELLIHGQAAGVFVIDREAPRHVLAATVTGIAPYVSMIRAAERDPALRDRRQMLVIHGASHAAELEYYGEELGRVAREGWLTYVPTVSRPWETPEWSGEAGRVEDVLRKWMDAAGFGPGDSLVYACGHPMMIENVKGIAARARFPKERIRTERFFPLRAVAAEGA